MANKYSKIKSKIHPIAYIIGAIFIILIIIAIVAFRPSASEKIQKSYQDEQIKLEGATNDMLLSKDHVFRKASLEDIDRRIQAKNLVIVYEGATWCETCLKEVQTYSEEFKKNEKIQEIAEKILYLEIPEEKELSGLKEFEERYGIKDSGHYPKLRAYFNGELLDVTYVPGQQGAELKTRVRDFYNEVFDKITKTSK